MHKAYYPDQFALWIPEVALLWADAMDEKDFNEYYYVDHAIALVVDNALRKMLKGD